MEKYVVIRKDTNGRVLMETPCPMSKREANQMRDMMESAGDSYIYEIKKTNKKSPFRKY